MRLRLNSAQLGLELGLRLSLAKMLGIILVRMLGIMLWIMFVIILGECRDNVRLMLG